MTNAIAYPDLALEKFTGLDSSEDALTFLNLTERKIGLCLGIRHATDATQQALYDQRRRDLFGSILRGPEQDWYDGLAVGKTWDDIKTEFLNRFTDDKDKYLKRIDAEYLKRQADENIKSYIYRVVKVVDLGWSGSSENELKQKYIDFFLRGLAPPALKQNAYQRKIEHPAELWDDLKTHVINKDLSYSISTSMTGIQSGPSDSRISRLEEQVRLLTEQLKENKINATYDPNNPRDKQNFTRFCKYCKKSGHTIKFCFKKKNDEELVEKQKKKTDQFRDENRKRSYSRERKDRERPRSSSYNGPRDRKNSYDRTHERQKNTERNDSYDRRDSHRRDRSRSNNENGRRERSFDTNTARYRSPTPNVRFDRRRSQSDERVNALFDCVRSNSPSN